MLSLKRTCRSIFCGLLILLAATSVHSVNAQTSDGAATSSAPSSVDANNPLAEFRAFNIHNYYIPSLTDLDNQNANTFWLRYAQPVNGWLFRASLPVQRVPAGASGSTSGLGDFSAFATYLFDTGDPAVSFGVGPQIVAPTASEDATGTGKWQAGLAATYFNAKSSTLQWGGLITWQASVAGDSDRDDTSLLALQPFVILQMGKGWYLRSTAIAAFNLETDSYNVPIGLGVGKVIPAGKMVFNVFAEPQFTILDRGAGQPETQLFIGFNTQLVN